MFGTANRPSKVRILLLFIKSSHKIFFDLFYDASRYIKYSSTFHLNTSRNLRSRITSKYHEIEKGLSLSQPRVGFGAERLNELLTLINEYIERFGKDSSLASPVGALRAYIKFHEDKGIYDFPYKDSIGKLLAEIDPLSNATVGGVVELNFAGSNMKCNA